MSIDYTLAVSPECLTKIPENFIEEKIPAGKYAVYTYKGKITPEKINEFMTNIYSKWLGEDGLIPLMICDFECYDNRWIDDSDDSEFDYYVSVRQR